jgi:hypothetical protein
MSLVIPTLLSRADSEQSENTAGNVYPETSARLLEIAGVDQAAFRSVVAGMSDGQRSFMEVVIKSGRGTVVERRDDDGEGKEPTIALRMNFGGGA